MGLLSAGLLTIGARGVMAPGECAGGCSATASGGALTSSPSPSGLAPAPTSAAAPTSPAGTTATSGFDLPPAGSPVLVFGDSYTEGTGATSVAASYPAQLAALLGWVVDQQGVGGTGFVAPGAVEADYRKRIAALPASKPQLVLVEGGLNDALVEGDAAQELAAAREVLTALRTRYPQAEVVVLGPPPVQVVDPTAVTQVDQALRQASDEFGVTYLSPLAESWGLEQYTTADGLHPDDAGHQYLALRVAAELRRLGG